MPSPQPTRRPTVLKARALAWAATVRTAAGQRPVVRTSNEESNAMLAIIWRPGFEERPAVVRLERTVAHRPGRV